MTRTRSGAHDLLERIGGFAGLSLAGSLAPFLVLPVAARLASGSEWAALALGQSVGGLVAICVNLGWNLTGPSMIAAASPGSRPGLYAESLVSRCLALCVALPLSSIAVSLLAPAGHVSLAVAMTAAALMAGIGVEWYCVGTGSWRDIARYELLPRFVASLVAVFVLVASGEIFFYPLIVAMASFLGVAVFSLRELRGISMRARLVPANIFAALKRSRMAVLTEVAGGTYSIGSTALVSSTAAVAEVAFYSSGDRVYRLALQSVVAISRALQGWVISEHGISRRRVGAALAGHGILGVLGGIVMGILGPWVSGLLFGDRLAFNAATGWAFGCAFLAVAWNTALGRLLLVPSGDVRSVMTSTIVGALLGVPAILAGAALWGASGGALGLALSQVAVCLCQVPPSINAWRRAFWVR